MTNEPGLPITATNAQPWGDQTRHVEQRASFYDRVGGHETFRRLVEVFYAGVATDQPLRALYPERDLGPAADRLRLFLEQYWGGPKTYSDTRGHPRLRIRHAPYAVTPDQRDRWLRHMLAAVDSLDLPALEDEELRDYLIRAANFMVNTFGEDDPPSGEDDPATGENPATGEHPATRADRPDAADDSTTAKDGPTAGDDGPTAEDDTRPAGSAPPAAEDGRA